MKNQLLILFIFGFSIFGNAQTDQSIFESKLIEHFQRHFFEEDVKLTKDCIYTSPYKEKFKVSIGNLIAFDTAHIVIENPYFSKTYEDSEDEKDYGKNYPKSFSVIYQSTLISLSENGKFLCYEIDNLQRNTELEDKLNTRKFSYHWIINNKLGGLSGNSILIWDDNKWIKFKGSFPLRNQPKLFEDDKFIVFGDCFGEWGGTVYFFEKSTAKTYFTESTCANSVIKDEKGYKVLAHLGHGGGFAEIKTIVDPTRLTVAKLNEIGKSFKGQALGYNDKSNAFIKSLDLYGVQIFSSFVYLDKVLYLVNLSDLTFIAGIKNNRIEIVNTLFFNDLYTHNPITTRYGNYTLMNLDDYERGWHREIAVLIINGNKITKLDWNQRHD